MDRTETPDNPDSTEGIGRRRLLKLLTAGGVTAAVNLMPVRWGNSWVQLGALPAHAACSNLTTNPPSVSFGTWASDPTSQRTGLVVTGATGNANRTFTFEKKEGTDWVSAGDHTVDTDTNIYSIPTPASGTVLRLKHVVQYRNPTANDCASSTPQYSPTFTVQ